MDKKQELEAKLEELQAHGKDTDKRINEIKQEIKDTEVTYSIGDRFKYGGAKYLLAANGDGKYILTSLENGCVWYGSHEAKYRTKITPKEFERAIEAGFIRYYDHKKRRKV